MSNSNKNLKCADCDNFIGARDWDLCCKNPPESQITWAGHLCYDDTPACENFKPLLRIRLRTDRPGDWEPKEFPLHTGKHSQ